MSFCRSTAKRIVRSLRRRSDRCHLSWWKEKVNYPTEDILQQKGKNVECDFMKARPNATLEVSIHLFILPIFFLHHFSGEILFFA